MFGQSSVKYRKPRDPRGAGGSGAAGLGQPCTESAQWASVPRAHTALPGGGWRVTVGNSAGGRLAETRGRQLLGFWDRPEPGDGKGWSPGLTSQVWADPSPDPSSTLRLSLPPTGRHRLAGPKAWPMDPAQRLGTEPRGQGGLGAGGGSAMGLQALLESSGFPLPSSQPTTCNVLGLQKTRGKKNLRALEVWQ